MKTWVRLFIILFSIATAASCFAVEENAPKKIYVIPIRDDIMPPLTYLVRRGVKEAMEAKADVLVLDMETNGGRIDTTKDIIAILDKFPGRTITYVNHTAFSAGAFIAVSTQEIYMAPQSQIGAAAPIMVAPGGQVQSMPDTLEIKMVSAVNSIVRASAEKNHHNVDVVRAMIDKNFELTIDGEVLKQKGDLLALTNLQAEKTYGNPPKPLLSSGTYDSLDSLFKNVGLANAQRVDVNPTGVEKIGSFLQQISPILLIIGIIGVYIEFKTPGFGLPGIVGITAFTIYFLGGYIAGLSGIEWLAIFILGLALLFLELLIFPGTLALGITGAVLMVISLVMALVDTYPGMPTIPTLPQLQVPLQTLGIAAVGSAVAVLALARVLPETPIFRRLVSTTASGEISTVAAEAARSSRVGQVGVALSQLRPGGKAQFGDDIIDVMTQGELLAKGTRVRIIRHSSTEAVVEPA